MKIHRTPRHARIVKHSSNRAVEAWFYENAKSIDVYVRQDGFDALSCRIPREALVDWINRTKA